MYEETRPCDDWGRGLAASDIDGDGKSDLAFVGKHDMQVMAWKPLGITRVLHHQKTPEGSTVPPIHLMAGQVDGQLGNAVVRPFHAGRYFFGGWYNASDMNRHVRPDGAPWGGSSSRVLDAAAADVDGDGKLEAVLLIEDVSWTGRVWLVVSDDPHHQTMSATTLGSPDSCSPPTLGSSIDTCPKIDSRTATSTATGASMWCWPP